MQFDTRFGWGTRVPPTATLGPGGAKRTKLVSKSVLHFGSNSPLLVSARPAWYACGVVHYLRDIEGKTVTVNVTDLVRSVPSSRVYEVNSLEEIMKRVSGKIFFAPWQVRSLMVER